MDDAENIFESKDLYKRLGVSCSANANEIKTAYRQRSLKYHPDKNLSDPAAKFKFHSIAEAFAVLSDPEKRRKYDESGDMDLDGFDIDRYLNGFMGRIMAKGGAVDKLMQENAPWPSEQAKMIQFMEEHTTGGLKKCKCLICNHSASTRMIMLVHFDQQHKLECDEWAEEIMGTMKASFESFMRQVTGTGDNTGKFFMPDGSQHNIKNMEDVPDLRGHVESKLTKVKAHKAVNDMYRQVAGDENFVPSAEDIADVLDVSDSRANRLRSDKTTLLKRLKEKIDRLNEQEDEEMETLHASIEALERPGTKKKDLVAILGGSGFDELAGQKSSRGTTLLDTEVVKPPRKKEVTKCSQGALLDTEVVKPPRKKEGIDMVVPTVPTLPSEPISGIACTCGHSFGTKDALARHLQRFCGDSNHKSMLDKGVLPLQSAGSQSPGGNNPKTDSFLEAASAASKGNLVQNMCQCGFKCGAARLLNRHLRVYSGEAGHALVRSDGSVVC